MRDFFMGRIICPNGISRENTVFDGTFFYEEIIENSQNCNRTVAYRAKCIICISKIGLFPNYDNYINYLKGLAEGINIEDNIREVAIAALFSMK